MADGCCLSSWVKFLLSYGDVHGKLVRYKRVQEGWKIDAQGSAYAHEDLSGDWTVRRYWNWYQNALTLDVVFVFTFGT
jgi:hypothetical protein